MVLKVIYISPKNPSFVMVAVPVKDGIIVTSETGFLQVDEPVTLFQEIVTNRDYEIRKAKPTKEGIEYSWAVPKAKG